MTTTQRASTFVRLAGEFMVIVVGVLLALAADRWNQDRLERDLAADYFSSLLAELAADSIRLDQHAAQASVRIATCGALLDVVNGTAPDSTARQLYLQCAGNEPPHVGGATFNEIQNTGSLRLLPEGVAQLVFDYYGFAEGTLNRAMSVRNVERRAMTEAANRSGAWLPRDRLSLFEFTERLRTYPDIESVVTGCLAFQASESALIRGFWLPRLTDVLRTLRQLQAG